MRTNLRGLSRHLEDLVDRISRAEFEGDFYECCFDKRLEPNVLAQARDGYLIYFNFKGARDFFLAASEHQLRNLVRHELIHQELDKGLIFVNGEGMTRGNSHGDLDFERECKDRGVPLSFRSKKGEKA